MNFKEMYRYLRETLVPVCGEFSDYEARQILEYATGCHSENFAVCMGETRPLASAVVLRIKEILRRRSLHEPLEYILGEAWFCGLPFHVTPDCLIPQADTEVVCEQVKHFLPPGGKMADIGTGSGCIALAVLAGTKDTKAVGYDISEAALSVAEENAMALGLSSRFSSVCSDIFAADFMEGSGQYDVIVSNPPYIVSSRIPTLAPEVRAEPVTALDGGPDGLRFYRRLLEVCPSHVKHGGAIVFEIGYDQRTAMESLCAEKGLPCEIFQDFGGNDRVCVINGSF